MTRGRKGTPPPTSSGGVEVVEAQAAFSKAQGARDTRPKARTPSSAPDGGGQQANDRSVGHKRPRAPEWKREYRDIWKSVNELGAEQFTGKEKRAYEARKIVERGGRAPKQQKMPYVMLQGIRKKAKQREERREAMEAESGIVTGKADGSDRRRSKQTASGRSNGSGRGVARRPGISANASGFGPAPSVGMMKSGVLHVSRNSISSGGGRTAGGKGHGQRSRGGKSH